MITSQSNQNIKLIRSLRQRKERERTNLFFVEGIRLVGEAVQLQASVETVVYAPELLTSQFGQELVAIQQKQGVSCLEVSADVFKSLSLKEGPQGIGAVVYQRWEILDNIQSSRELCWVALESAQDPGNVGTILRTSDAVGSAGLILLDNSTDPYDPAALRASMGAVFSQRLVRTTFAEFAGWKKQHRYQVVGTSDKGAEDYQAVRYPQPLILLMGSERQGLAPAQQNLCDTMVKIPMVGRSDSLNLAVATGIVLYEIFNQQRKTKL